MNKIITIGVIGVAAYGVFNLLRMKNVSDEMHTKVDNPRIGKIDWSGLTVKADAIISNPTKDSMSITKPVVTLSSNGKVITQSTPENQNIVIKPLTVTKIEGIEIPISWNALSPYVAGIIGKIPSIIASIKGKKVTVGSVLNIPLEMQISTYADGMFVKSSPIKLT